MASLFQSQTGNRTYGLGTRMAPNKGRVSANGAQGYMQRELRKRKSNNGLRVGQTGQRLPTSSVSPNGNTGFTGTLGQRAPVSNVPSNGNTGFNGSRQIVSPRGGDGQSDRRSGAAAQMLRQKMVRVKKTANGSSMQTTTEKQFAPKPTATEMMQDRISAQKLEGQAQTPPALQVNASGLLELPYNQQFAEGQYDAINQANDQLLGLKAEADQQGLQYGQQKRQIKQAYDGQRAQTLNQNAAGGTAFSSMYGTAVANNAGAFANQMGDLEGQNTSYNQNLAAQRAAIQNNLSGQIQRATQTYGDALGEEAGTLGYGKNKRVVTSPHKPKPKPKANHQKAAKTSLSKQQRERRRKIKRGRTLSKG